MRIGLVLSLLFLLPAPALGEQVIDGIAAQVGSEIVLISEVRAVSAPAENRLRETGGGDREIAMLQAEVLEQMIERALIRQVVIRAELEATDLEVDEAIAAIGQDNGLNPDQLRESVESQGLPYEAYRQRIRSEIEHSKVMNGMVAARVRVEEQEVRDLYEQEFSDQPTGGEEFHLRHLLVPTEGRSKSAARAKAQAALARIRGGESFQSVAAEEGVVNPQGGGDIGWLHTTQMAGWMGPAVDALQPGQTSSVIETDFGSNLLQVVERRAYQQITYEQARERLRQHLFGERMNVEYREFIDSLREQTYIERKGFFADASRLDVGAPADADPGAGQF